MSLTFQRLASSPPCHVLTTLVTIFIGSCIPSWATGSEVNTLDPIVVTASPIPMTQKQSPAPITVVRRKNFQYQQNNRLAGILQQVPGLFVDEMGGRGGTSSIYSRGGDPNFTLVMLDGVPLNDSTNQRGGSVDLSQIAPERISRIEVVRGPASVQYGPDAMAGIINLITFDGQDHPHSQAKLESGPFGYVRGIFHTSGKKEHVRYSGTSAFTHNDDIAKGDHFESGNIGGSFSWSSIEGLRLRGMVQYSHVLAGLFPEGSGGSRLAILKELENRKTDEVVSGLSLSHEIFQHFKQEWIFHFLYRNQDVNSPGVKSSPSTFEIPPSTFTTTFLRYRMGWTLNATISPAWKSAIGWQVVIEDGNRTGIQQFSALGFPTNISNTFHTTRTIPGGFLEISYSFIPQITLTAGTRIDGPKGYPVRVTPRAGLNVQPFTHTIVRANYSQGFKLPSLNALSDPLTGNPSLLPEASRTWDIGVQQSFWSSRVILELTYFHNRFKNLIDLDPALANQGTFTLVNLSTVVTSGLEVGLTATPHSAWAIQGSYTYLNADILNSGERLRNRPRSTGSLAVEFQPTIEFTIRGQVRAVGDRVDFQVPTRETIVPGFVRTDISATFQMSRTWTVFGVIENVLNHQYEEYAGFQAPGQWIRFGLEYLLDG